MGFFSGLLKVTLAATAVAVGGPVAISAMFSGEDITIDDD